MCEFKVILDGELVAEDVIYAREEGASVIVRSIVGDEKRLDGCRIIEVDSVHEKLVLTRS